MRQHAKEYLGRLLSDISSINLVPVRNVRPWFPTSEHEVTFRIATSEEIIYLSFPADWDIEKDEKSLPTSVQETPMDVEYVEEVAPFTQEQADYLLKRKSPM